jgi:outer membrane lipase/esterase
MSRYSLRRALAAAAVCASAALLAACGSSTTESALSPQRLIVFGDAFADVGQSGVKYTVNDGSTNQWVQRVAERFGTTVSASSTAGGLGYARAGARIANKPDVAGDAATLTVTEQIDEFLAASRPVDSDLVFLTGGIADLVVAGQAFLNGTQTQAELVATAEQAGRDMAVQTRRLVNAGATHVVVVGPYDVSVTPWGQGSGKIDALREASRRYNDVFKVAIVDLGDRVLYVDAAYYFNLVASEPGDFSLNNSVLPVCTSVDAGPGIGLGAGQLNSALCTNTTVLPGVEYNRYMFADALYTTPNVQRLFGDYAYDRIRNRW